MKWGLLGASGIARSALMPAFERAENTEVVAVASLSGKGQAFAEEFNIPKVYNDYEAMLQDQEIDAVYISLPNDLHKEWTIKAAEHGKHVLCEKPAATTYSDAKEMIDACEKHGVKFLEAFMYQFHPQHECVREIIQSGEIGEVNLMKASFSFYLDTTEENIRLDKEKGGGAIFDIGCYGLHSVFAVLESKPVEINRVADIHSELEVDLSDLISMKMENGVLAQVDCSFQQPFKQSYEVIGTKGRIKVLAAYRPDVVAEDGPGTIVIETDEGTREEVVTGDQYKLEVDALTEAVTAGRSLEKYSDLTLTYLKTIEAAMR
ncbi:MULTISPECIES: Gfo/Idh/MocA family protein [Bacillaceae]|uniref:Gfo/Idh/MocA family oxidoreductase n=1 Tax=Evansella alkalicola TaxID=745819 RepID=A0ABS6JPU0_9BACI|nr:MULTISPECIES: Gfo/Idh/MocA family oxidoreductase [Bacillaceae]MBU9720574.1 Gfo/Idh/MocA family oxidoreductase [Bacillus alkalicola]